MVQNSGQIKSLVLFAIFISFTFATCRLRLIAYKEMLYGDQEIPFSILMTEGVSLNSHFQPYLST